MTAAHSFSKNERLCNKESIDKLFAGGQSFTEFPYKVIYKTRSASGEIPAQVLISVPKRNFRRAVKRNLLKRLFREAYRKNKTLFTRRSQHSNCRLRLLYIPWQTGLPLAALEEKIIISLQRIIKAHEQSV